MQEDNNINQILDTSDDVLLKKGYQPTIQRPVLPPPQGGSSITPVVPSSSQNGSGTASSQSQPAPAQP